MLSMLLRRCAAMICAPCLVVCLFLASGIGTAAHAAGGLDQLLAYNSGAPLNIRVVGREHRPGVLIEDISFDSASGSPPVSAYLVRPTLHNAPFAGIVYGHWFDPTQPNSNRTQFLKEAAALARLGVVSVLPNMLWSDLSWFDKRSWRNDFASTLGQAKDLRRALDVLLAQSGVDPKRIAFVGHDFSALHGALIAGVETRVKSWLLIAGTAKWADWYLFGAADGKPAGDELTAYLAQLAPIDPLTAITQAKSAEIMFQFGEKDFYTPRENFLGFYRAAPAPKRINTYQSEHEMTQPIIVLDRNVWLGEQLGLPLLRRLSGTSGVLEFDEK
jgi:dienelactone hydrolase